MPSNKNTQAAVPFVNQKGEVSMKRVRVERYVAGKRPSYAKDDEEDEYYTTDDEDDDQSKASSSPVEDDEDEGDEEVIDKDADKVEVGEEEEDEDDDPRFKKLKEVESKTQVFNISEAPKVKESVISLDEDEDEEDIKERHRIARARTIEPVEPHVVPVDTIDNSIEPLHQVKREQTEDIMKDFELDGLQLTFSPDEDKADAQGDERQEDAIQEATFLAQLNKKIEEDKKIDLRREALGKGLVGLDSVDTDDDDEEIAYAEWQLREIKRILRDKAERESETRYHKNL